MQRVIVTVKRQNEARVRDLEVPAEVEAERLSEMIAQALRWESDPAGQPVEYEIMAEPPGRVLAPYESLAEAGAWDGAWLVLQPAGSFTPPPPLPLPPPIPEGPTTGRTRSIIPPELQDKLDLSERYEPVQEEAPPEATGFVWKQLD